MPENDTPIIIGHCLSKWIYASTYWAIIWVNGIKCAASGGIHKFTINEQLVGHVNCHVIHFHIKLKVK